MQLILLRILCPATKWVVFTSYVKL